MGKLCPTGIQCCHKITQPTMNMSTLSVWNVNSVENTVLASPCHVHLPLCLTVWLRVSLPEEHQIGGGCQWERVPVHRLWRAPAADHGGYPDGHGVFWQAEELQGGLVSTCTRSVGHSHLDYYNPGLPRTRKKILSVLYLFCACGEGLGTRLQ